MLCLVASLASLALALEITPTPLPAEPVLAWGVPDLDGQTALWITTVGGEPAQVAVHDGSLAIGPRLTRHVVLLEDGPRRWWVDLASGAAHALPDEVSVAYADPDRIVLWDPAGAVWQAPPGPEPQLRALGTTESVLGVVDGLLLLASGARIEAVWPTGERAPWVTLRVGSIPAGTVGWALVGTEALSLEHPDGSTSWLPLDDDVLQPELGRARAQLEPGARLVVRRRRLLLDGRVLARGAIGSVRWWAAPQSLRWDEGFLDHLRVPPGHCVEVVDTPLLRCSTGIRGLTLSAEPVEPVEGYLLACPEGTWRSGNRSASPALPLRGEGWWCVDRALRRQGPAMYRTEEGHVAVGLYLNDALSGSWILYGPDGAVLEVLR